MDYFNQYTYASVTANMIGEIAYIETLTLISTIISTSLIMLGSWTTQGTTQFLANMGAESVKSTLGRMLLITGKVAMSIVGGAVKETFEEIIKDGFIETWAERQVELWGGTEDMGFWFSALCTSGRETISGSAKGIRTMMKSSSDQKTTIDTALSNSENLNAWVSQNMAKDYKSDAKSRKAIMEQIKHLKATSEADILLKAQKKSSILKIARSGLITALKFTMTSMFLGSQTMSSMLSLSGFSSTIKGVSASLYGRYKTNIYNARVGNHLKLKNVFKTIADPKSDIDSEAYANKFAEQTGGEQMISTDTNIKAPGFPIDASNPSMKSEIAQKTGESLLSTDDADASQTVDFGEDMRTILEKAKNSQENLWKIKSAKSDRNLIIEKRHLTLTSGENVTGFMVSVEGMEGGDPILSVSNRKGKWRPFGSDKEFPVVGFEVPDSYTLQDVRDELRIIFRQAGEFELWWNKEQISEYHSFNGFKITPTTTFVEIQSNWGILETDTIYL